jgi:hypothetical protein
MLSATPVAGDATAVDAAVGQELLTLQLKPIDLDLLGLQVTTDPITVTVSAAPGDGQLIGNLLNSASSLINLDEISAALNSVLGSAVDLVNSVDLQVAGVGSGVFSTGDVGTTDILDLLVAPVHLDVLGADVRTSPVHLHVAATAGDGLVLGNVLTALSDVFNPPLPEELDIATINTRVNQLLDDLNAQIPGIAAATTPTREFEQGDILSLTIPTIDVDLLGLVLQTTPITVDARAATGDGLLLGNILTSVLNTLDATPEQLHELSDNLNELLAKVVGVLNASNLVLPSGALDSLSEAVQTLSLPDLITAEPGARTTVLDLVVASPTGTTPPVMVDLLGLNVTASNIDAVLLAETGEGNILGNIVYNVANLLNPGGSASLFALITDLATGTSSGTLSGSTLDTTNASQGPVTQVLTLTLPPLDLDLLGLEVDSSVITVTVSTQTGDGNLLGNALSGLTSLLDTEAVSAALNNVLDSVVTLVNSADIEVAGILDGTFTTAPDGVTPILNLVVAPVHLDLLGVIVETSPIQLSVQARSGAGLVLGNVLTSISDLFNPPLPDELDLAFINNRLNELLADLEEQAPGIPSATVPPPVITDDRILSLTLPALDLNLLGLLLTTEPITVNGDATTGDGLLLGNVLQTVLNTLDATPEQLTELSANLNELVGKVFGVLNASTLLLSDGVLDTLTGPLATLAQPDLISATPGATTQILDLSIASTDGVSPPVSLDVLGLTVTTSNIDATLAAQTGDGMVLGNLLYNVANLLNSGGPAGLLFLLNQLAAPQTPSTPQGDDLVAFHDGEWHVGTSNGTGFTDAVWAKWNPNAAWDALLHADVDGDGLSDVIGFIDGEWWVGRNTGSSYETSRWTKWANVDWKDAASADLNGDGKADLLARIGGNWWAALSTGSGVGGPALWATWSNVAWDDFFLTDLTADGNADLLGFIDGAAWVGVSTGTRFAMPTRWARWAISAWDAIGTGDFNGDGRQDLYIERDGEWMIGRSTGTTFQTLLRARWKLADWKNPVVGDFNNDGRDDVAARYNGRWWVGISNAAGGQASVSRWATWSDSDWKDVIVGDFDGDGNEDIAGRLGGAWSVALSSGTAFDTSVWATVDDVAWQAVAAVEAATSGTSAATTSATTRSSATSSQNFALARASAAAKTDESVSLFWSQAEKDDAFVNGLLTAV